MDLMFVVQLLFRWIHVFGAIVLVGGIIFQYCVLRPASADSAAAGPDPWAVTTRARWRTLVMLSIAMLLVSGFVNLFLILSRYDFPDTFPSSAYHATFGIKFLLGLAVFYFSSRLVGRSAGAERFRTRETFWTSFNLILAVIVVCLAGFMKLADRRPKDTPAAPPAGTAAATPDRSL